MLTSFGPGSDSVCLQFLYLFGRAPMQRSDQQSRILFCQFLLHDKVLYSMKEYNKILVTACTKEESAAVERKHCATSEEISAVAMAEIFGEDGRIKDEESERTKQITLTSMQKEFRSRITFFAYLLVLLAGLTFAGVLNPPGSFDEKGFMRTDRWKIYTFVNLNCLSFCFSMSALVLCLIGSLPPFPSSQTHEASRGELKEQMSDTTRLFARNVAFTLFTLVVINILFAISLTCCVLAFLFATFGILKPDTAKKLLKVTMGISVVCTLVSDAWLLHDSFRFFQRARFSLATLTESLTESAGSRQSQLRYGLSPTSVCGEDKEEDEHRRPISPALSLPNTCTSLRPFTCRPLESGYVGGVNTPSVTCSDDDKRGNLPSKGKKQIQECGRALVE